MINWRWQRGQKQALQLQLLVDENNHANQVQGYESMKVDVEMMGEVV